MQPFGSDRCRVAGGRVILRSTTLKGWVATTPRTTTSVEHPGTAVAWEDQYWEVVSAEPSASGGAVYVLSPWRDEMAMRHVDRYDQESEAARIADALRAVRQRRHSALSRFAGILLGHLPGPVQHHLANELGVSAATMTMQSAIPPLLLLGWCAWSISGNVLGEARVELPAWIVIAAVVLTVDAGVRFFVAMSQGRGMGSMPGTALYVVVWAFAPKSWKLVPPFRPAPRLAALPVPEEIAKEDALSMRAPLMTLLAPADQRRLAATVGFDYRRDARPVTMILLTGSLSGVIAMAVQLRTEARFSAVLSFALASILAADQIRRLVVLRHGPAGSVLAPLIRPFFRDLL